MDYTEAFNRVLKEYGFKILESNFLFRSCLLDYLSSSYSSNRLAEAFYVLNKEPLHRKISSCSIDDVSRIINVLINSADKKYDKETYLQSCEPLLMLLYPRKYQKIVQSQNSGTGSLAKNQKSAAKLVFKKGNEPRKKNKQSRDILIDAICKKLIITSSYDNKIHINARGRHSPANVKDHGSYVDIGILTYSTCQLMLPIDNKQTINIKFSGNKLMIGSKKSKAITAKEVNIDALGGKIAIDGNFGKVHVLQSLGKLSFNGNISTIIATNKHGKTICDVSSNNPTLYAIKSTTGIIECAVNGKGNIPSTKKLFRRLTHVNNTCVIGKHNVRVSLNTEFGKIKLY